MKQIVLRNSRATDAPPIRVQLDDGIASAVVRSGAGAPHDSADYAELAAGAPLSGRHLIDAAVQAGPLMRVRRMVLPAAVVRLIERLGLGSAVQADTPQIPVLAIYDETLGGYVRDELLGGDFIVETPTNA